jgi:hypothetical protein
MIAALFAFLAGLMPLLLAALEAAEGRARRNREEEQHDTQALVDRDRTELRAGIDRLRRHQNL